MSEEEFHVVRQDIKQLELRVDVLTEAGSAGVGSEGEAQDGDGWWTVANSSTIGLTASTRGCYGTVTSLASRIGWGTPARRFLNGGQMHRGNPWAIGNQDLVEEAGIPGIVESIRSRDGNCSVLGEQDEAGHYEWWHEREERLMILADLFPDADDYIVINDLDLSHVDGWHHYHV